MEYGCLFVKRERVAATLTVERLSVGSVVKRIWQHVPADAFANLLGCRLDGVASQVSVYRAVVCNWVGQRSLPIIVRLSPKAIARDANVCRRSWKRASSSPACSRMRG